MHHTRNSHFPAAINANIMKLTVYELLPPEKKIAVLIGMDWFLLDFEFLNRSSKTFLCPYFDVLFPRVWVNKSPVVLTIFLYRNLDFVPSLSWAEKNEFLKPVVLKLATPAPVQDWKLDLVPYSHYSMRRRTCFITAVSEFRAWYDN